MHTSGPWRAIYRGAGGWAISNGTWTEYLRDARLTKHDAHLIAAAPDLLTALELAQTVLRGHELNKTTLQQALEQAANAVARAKGES
jgi:hypothetical protein